MLEHACWFEDWGIAVELDQFQSYDHKISTINAKICQLQLDITTVEHDCTLCKQWLKALRCTEGLTNLKGLGPKSAYAKWSTHFTDDEDEPEFCTLYT
jgi:hypothetical protein